MRRIVAGLVPCLLGACLGTARAATPEVVTFKGICDASAAIALDADHIIVGDDEKRFSRSIVSTVASGPTSSTCLTSADTTRRTSKARPFWPTGSSGSRPTAGTRTGRSKHERFQLFASHRLDAQHQWTEDFSPSFAGLPKAIRATEGDDYKPLRKAVGDLDDDDPDLAPKEHGFNVEGLTVSEDGQALLGRSAQSASARRGDPVPDRQRGSAAGRHGHKAKLGGSSP